MFRFTIRDVLWLMVVVGLGVGWWEQRHDMLATQSRLRAELNSAQNENHRIAADHKMLADDWKLLVWSFGKLEIDAAHLVSAARIADRYHHRRYQVLIEPRPLDLKDGGMDVSY